jgi:hypothetical protein
LRRDHPWHRQQHTPASARRKPSANAGKNTGKSWPEDQSRFFMHETQRAVSRDTMASGFISRSLRADGSTL